MVVREHTFRVNGEEVRRVIYLSNNKTFTVFEQEFREEPPNSGKSMWVTLFSQTFKEEEPARACHMGRICGVAYEGGNNNGG